MAAIIFSKSAGHVVSFPDPTLPARISLRMTGWGGYSGFKAIITRVGVSAQGNLQFLHTLGGQVYIYVFGERIGQMTVSGLAFDSSCEDPGGTIGIERVLSYYNQARVASRALPLKVTIGAASTLPAYLVGASGEVADPKLRIWQFSLRMALIPSDEHQSSTSAFGAGTSGTSSSGGGAAAGGTTGGTTGGATFPDPPPIGTGGLEEPDVGGYVARRWIASVPAGDGFVETLTGPSTDLVKGFA